MNVSAEKRAAAEHAAAIVEDGMIVGLGSGSTAELAIEALGRRHDDGLRFTGVATSRRTEQMARSFGIRLSRLDMHSRLDLTIDGADEVDPCLNLVKGRGGALTREKLVANAATRFVVVVDEGKLVQRLGEKAPIPVEIVPFGWTTTRQRLEEIGLTCELRREVEHIYLTSNHNFILDCHPAPTLDLAQKETGMSIKCQTGVVEHGLFLRMTSLVVVGCESGEIRVLSAD